MYHIYKKSINEYRVLNTETRIFVITNARYLAVFEPKFIVDQSGYQAAKQKQFVNSGNAFDYFAYIQTDHLPVVCADKLSIPRKFNQIKFNPFKANYFFQVSDNQPVKEAFQCLVNENDLFFLKKVC